MCHWGIMSGPPNVEGSNYAVDILRGMWNCLGTMCQRGTMDNTPHPQWGCTFLRDTLPEPMTLGGIVWKEGTRIQSHRSDMETTLLLRKPANQTFKGAYNSRIAASLHLHDRHHKDPP
jgi:hypothetical protein